MLPAYRVVVVAFHQPAAVQQRCFVRSHAAGSGSVPFPGRGSCRLHGRKVRTMVEEDEEQAATMVFDPLNLASAEEIGGSPADDSFTASNQRRRTSSASKIATSTGLVATALAATAQQVQAIDKAVLSQGSMDPAKFVPVCPTSDGFYRFLQTSTEAVVGEDAFVQYGPLIAGGLLRVRLELCVVESFVYEAVVPFVKKNGVSWILPIHETVETFLAGVIFALATTFILIGSTKILTVIVTYADFLVGLPSRILGGFAFDRASGKPVTLDVGFGPFKTRLVGPPEKEGEDSNEVDFSSLGPLQLVTVIISGAVKVVGIVVGVSASICRNGDVDD